MKNSQSKFSNEKSQSSSSSKPSSSSSSSSGCCCGSKLSDEIDEVEISEMEENNFAEKNDEKYGNKFKSEQS